MPAPQSSYTFEQVRRAGLRRGLSEDRFATYLAHCGGDERRACERYTWNVAMASAFYGPLQALEVTMRNAVNDRLRGPCSDWWFRDDQLLGSNEIEKANKSYNEAVRRNGPAQVSPGQVVADLPLSFWVALFADAYEKRLWVPHLHRLFVAKTDRKALHADLDRIRTLRNRVAHHEPIFRRNAEKDLKRLQRITEALNPDVWD